jgi:hypothetical protein
VNHPVNNARAHANDIAIECSIVRKCGWKGMESDLDRRPHKSLKGATQLICPSCGCDSYYRREIGTGSTGTSGTERTRP